MVIVSKTIYQNDSHVIVANMAKSHRQHTPAALMLQTIKRRIHQSPW